MSALAQEQPPATQPSQQPHLLLVDASGFIFRAFYSLPPLTRGDGTPVGAVYGFCNMLVKLLSDMQADHIAVVFDAGRYTFRNELYDGYKANRAETPPELIPQFPLVREATRAFNLPAIELEGFEADDVMASYACAAAKEGWKVTLVSSDKDLMQLLTESHIGMYDPVKQKPISAAEVMDKFGVTPDKVIEVQALIGDSTDAVPGVPGIGPKTAAELINQFGSLEALLERLDEVPQPKRRETLREHVEAARLSYQLVTLKTDINPLPQPLEELKRPEKPAEHLEAFLKENRFNSLLTRLQNSGFFNGVAASLKPQLVVSQPGEVSLSSVSVQKVATQTHYVLVQDEATLAEWIAKATARGLVAFDTETTGLDAMRADLVGVSLAVGEGEACYIPLAHRSKGQDTLLAIEPAVKQLALAKAMALLKPLFENPAVLKIAHNLKYDWLVLKRQGVDVLHPVADTMVMSYALDNINARHGLDDLCERHLGHTNITFEDVIKHAEGSGNFADVPLDKALAYAAEDADMALRLYHLFDKRLQAEHLNQFYESCERPLVEVLTAMEYRGARVDVARLKELSDDFHARMKVLEASIYQQAGQEFLLSSPKQLGEILFDKLGIAGGKKTKTGAYQTGADILEGLAEQGHGIARDIVAWRQLSKLCNTYAETLPQQIHPKTGRVHTSYNMAVTSTGRLSSNNPNLQNIPIRTEDGRAIRSAFTAAPGHVLISADYSQIELRLLAHMADIGPLKEAFKRNEDIHRLTASQIFGVPLEQVDDGLRRSAKMINFGIIYGMSAFGLSERLGIGRKEAAEFIEAYFRQYPGIKHYMEATIADTRAKGYATTIYGRRCYVPGINDRNGSIRTNAERAAINAPIQGTAADIMRMAMVSTYRALKEIGMEQCLILQVHDELVLEVPQDRADELGKLVQKAMQDAAHLDVPLVVEVGTGPNWQAAH
jgi:DNA polymerase-1